MGRDCKFGLLWDNSTAIKTVHSKLKFYCNMCILNVFCRIWLFTREKLGNSLALVTVSGMSPVILYYKKVVPHNFRICSLGNEQNIQSNRKAGKVMTVSKNKLSKITNRRITKRTYGLAREQLLPKRCPLSYHSRT